MHGQQREAVHIFDETWNLPTQTGTIQRLYDTNGIFQMQGGKNRILPK
jgi:hypothetical protein